MKTGGGIRSWGLILLNFGQLIWLRNKPFLGICSRSKGSYIHVIYDYHSDGIEVK